LIKSEFAAAPATDQDPHDWGDYARRVEFLDTGLPPDRSTAPCSIPNMVLLDGHDITHLVLRPAHPLLNGAYRIDGEEGALVVALRVSSAAIERDGVQVWLVDRRLGHRFRLLVPAVPDGHPLFADAGVDYPDVKPVWLRLFAAEVSFRPAGQIRPL
jgi:hypothetical protein